MTISADRAANSDRLARTLALYRDLSLVLRDRITLLQTGTDGDGKAAGAAIAAHHRTLQTVLRIEADLGKHTRQAGDGVSLDLDAARAEVAARLARWAAAGGS